MDRSLLLDGTPWWVNFQFTVGNLATAKELVRPKFNTAIYNNIDGKQLRENNRIIILGIAYCFHTAADSGVTLEWRYTDDIGPQTVNIASAICGTTNATVANGYETFVPGVAGRIISGSAYAPASLYLAAFGTQPSKGHFKVWGIHVDSGWRVGKLHDISVGGTSPSLNFNTLSSNN